MTLRPINVIMWINHAIKKKLNMLISIGIPQEHLITPNAK